MDVMAGYLGDSVLVNGVPDAVLSATAAPHRFRILNGSNARIFRLAWSDGCAFHVLAGDAGLLEAPVITTELFLGPGERAELFVDLSADSGRGLDLLSLGFAAGGGPGPGMGRSDQGVPMRLLRVRVDRESGGSAALPTRLAPLEPLRPERAEVRRRFVMEMRMPPFAGNFLINGRSWVPGRIDVRAERGPLELWEVINVSAEPHPFHVHATQFRLVSRSSGPPGPHEGGLKDTVLVWPGERVELALRFERHAGLYLLHCHNLEHEDAGMMLNLEVV